ncbi:MAG: cytochrome c [Gemmatimonadetes bacterium]|nr:cytochrome c [Gemmatimonadota bacterium]
MSDRARGVLGLGLALLVSGACVPLDDFMGDVFGRSMRDQRSFDPYENTLLPPEGTVPMAAGNYPAGHFDTNVGQPEGSSDVPPPFTQLDMTQRPEVVDSLTNPVPPTAESLARGEQLYERVCIVCHGPDGAGTTAYIYEVHPYLATYPLTAETTVARSDGYLYGMIRVGRTLMPAYGHQISHYDRWHIVNYVRQMQGVGPGSGEAGAGEADGGGDESGDVEAAPPEGGVN